MTKFNFYIIGFISTCLLMISCDYVKDVRDPNVQVISGNRKVLVEDYTGHKCGNCPAAADTLKYLEKTYGDKIIPIAIHAGSFANINNAYPTDLRTPTGDAYDVTFGISLAGNPNGLINRVGYGSGGFIKSYSSWESETVQMLSTSAKFELKITNTFISSSNTLNSKITVKSLTTNSGQYKLVVLLTEDSIIAEQLDYRIAVPPAPSQKINNYEFKHVLRGAINSTWGDQVFTSGAFLNDSIVKSYSTVINTSYRPEKCHVVAYIYDADTNSPTYYEVLQAEEKHVK